jgi:4-hydroxy-3-polyprenylbenzoate decarboxylase
MFQTQRRTAESLGVNATLRGPALVDAIRKRMEDHKPVPPKLVASGPITEHVGRGKDIDVFRLPAPKRHKDDGGKYIGTTRSSQKIRKEIGSISAPRECRSKSLR